MISLLYVLELLIPMMMFKLDVERIMPRDDMHENQENHKRPKRNVFVCVCVCVREREREGSGSGFAPNHQIVSWTEVWLLHSVLQ